MKDCYLKTYVVTLLNYISNNNCMFSVDYCGDYGICYVILNIGMYVIGASQLYSGQLIL